MKNYKYIARNSSGARQEGIKQAVSEKEILSYLREKNFTPVKIEEVSADVEKKHKIASGRIKSADLAAVFWQLNTMLEGGILITTAMETIASDIGNIRLKKILEEMVENIHKGEKLSESVARYPRVFNRIACALILAGETGGSLPESLKRLAEYFDNRDKLVRKVKGAMAYPIFVLGFIIVILIFIMAFIIPRFRMIFTQLGNKLPAFTRNFIFVYDILCSNMIFIIGLISLLVFTAIFFYKRTQKGHIWFSNRFLKIPLIGNILKFAFFVTFCKTMSSLLKSGISVLEVFDILASMTSNDVIKSAIIKTKEHIAEGASVSLSMAAAGFFPNILAKMVRVGEECGSMSKVLDRTAEYYERRVDSVIGTLMTMLEPIMIITVGAIVLVVVLALYLPIFSMSDIRGNG